MQHTQKHTTTTPAGALRRLSLMALGGLVLAASSSCVAQAKYDEALDEARYYQRMYQDLEPYQGELEAENSLLRGQLEMYEQAAPIDAGYTAEIDQRLDELGRIASGLGSAPGDVTVLSVEGGYGYRLKGALVFDTASHEVRPEGAEALASLAREISQRPYARIWVRGHTDNVPIVKPATKERFPTNLHLSIARGMEVAEFLGQQDGIDPERIAVAGFGPSDPVASNASAEGRQLNRRCEIFVIEDAAAEASSPSSSGAPASEDSK